MTRRVSRRGVMKRRLSGLMGRSARPSSSECRASTPSVEWYAERLREMSPSDQLWLISTWPGVETVTPEGLTVFARTKKERRRLARERSAGTDAWMRSFRDGDVFYDIGANCGSFALAVGAMHQGRVGVVAIEPGYGNFESLVRNVSRAGLLSSVIPLQIALFDRTGIHPMNYYRSSEAGTSLHAVGEAIDHEGRPFEPVEVVMVPTFRLDDLIDVLELPAPTGVKIDVDGTEECVLRGAVRTLESRSIRDLMVEVVDHDRRGTRPDAVGAQLAAHGYELSAIHRHGGEASFVADYQFVRRPGSTPAA